MPDDFAKTILDAGIAMGAVERAGESGAPFVLVPNGARIEDLERLLEEPTRIRVTRQLHDPDSFIEYVNRFREAGTIIYFDQDNHAFKAILDHHIPTSYAAEERGPLYIPPQPRWCSHIAVYVAQQTPEWSRWTAQDGHRLSQADFAQFIEDNLGDIVDEQQGIMATVAVNLEIKKSVTFSGSHTTQTGATQLVYNEEIKGQAQTAQMTVPTTFDLVIAPFRGAVRRRAICKLRFRLQDRSVVFWYDIVNPERIAEDSLDIIRTEIANRTMLPVLAGQA